MHYPTNKLLHVPQDSQSTTAAELQNAHITTTTIHAVTAANSASASDEVAIKCSCKKNTYESPRCKCTRTMSNAPSTTMAMTTIAGTFSTCKPALNLRCHIATGGNSSALKRAQREIKMPRFVTLGQVSYASQEYPPRLLDQHFPSGEPGPACAATSYILRS